MAIQQRVVHLPPTIHFATQQVRMYDQNWTVQVGSPRGRPVNVRANQTLELSQGESGGPTYMTYAGILVTLQEDINDQVLLATLTQFVAAVDAAIPYDVHNLVHDVGAHKIMEVLAISGLPSMYSRLSHKISWTVDELVLLKHLYPRLDVEATMMRHCYVRAAKGIGLWQWVQTRPEGLTEFAAAHGHTIHDDE